MKKYAQGNDVENPSPNTQKVIWNSCPKTIEQ